MLISLSNPKTKILAWNPVVLLYQCTEMEGGLGFLDHLAERKGGIEGESGAL
jgi:hypothetical protein